jgi:hypothetical protein
MTVALAQWRGDQSAALLDVLETTSRGEDTLGPRHGGHRMIVTAFDPYALDYDIRRGNPSGSVALTLDGTVLRTAHGPHGWRPRSTPCGGTT